MTASSMSTWPAQRGTRSAIAAQFGDERADLLGWALHTGDDLADAVVEAMHHDGVTVRAQLNQGMTAGLASLDDPSPAIVAFLTHAETVPGWVDRAQLESGPQPWFTTPLPIHLIAQSAGSLVRVYASPSIGRVLALSGRLVEGASSRIQETGRWLAQSMAPGALCVGRPGYVATLQVRMLHAHMRRLARRKDFDQAANGTPINQVDLARTWMDFTRTSFMAEAEMGFAMTVGETAEMYRLWWYLGHLLGIDERLSFGVKNNEEAGRIDDMLQAVTAPPEPVSVTLVAATLRAVSDDFQQAMHVPSNQAMQVLETLTRRFHGDALANELEIPRHGFTDAILDPMIRLQRDSREKVRRNRTKWDAAIAKAVAHYPQDLADLPDRTTFTAVAAAPISGTD
ncbi:oxygenase MpaB family protein [Mycolicibacterium sp. P1-5]|uniref:oxygenase MpaB family protein n=1 Tax=Mycolicibacterium sp. P1-5 TaxID=2024617 RepID=UPI0011EDCF3F|nr:oxygenase MpaB family protein [Mycolicibacterium sp. P1-5]KAA0110662.1 DUF2236 domain-containing protein [Mycolicibacterium sp. P1-5]